GPVGQVTSGLDPAHRPRRVRGDGSLTRHLARHEEDEEEEGEEFRMNSTLTNLLQKLDEQVPRLHRLDRYYSGKSPLAYLAPEARDALGSRFGHLGSNLCRLAITSLSERLRITGFTTGGSPDRDLWADWIGNDMDQLAGVAHREALTLGSGFVVVWADRSGRPSISVESARQVTVQRDPGTRQITAAVKRWTTATTTEAVLDEPARITRWRAQTAGATTAGFVLVESLDNPLGVVPVVELRNTDRLLGPGTSELEDLIPLEDALTKLLADMMVGSEYYARPRRWGT